jgi:hypothetical protein
MKQGAIINELTRLSPEKQLLIINADGMKAQPGLFEMGIWLCPCCGYMQPIDFSRCKKCGEERFIVMEGVEE